MEQQEEKSPNLFDQKQKGRPAVRLSESYLNLTIEAGQTFYGSFKVISTNQIELSGRVLSTNDKVVLEQTKLSGTECQISFYFKGKLAIEGEEHFGDFLLLTNGGEFNLPYCITVVPKKLWIGEQSYGDMEEFGRFAKVDWKRAREAFFTKEFKEVFIIKDKKRLSLYQGLLKGRSKDVILDNFLQETAGKKPLLLSLSEKGAEGKPLYLFPKEEKKLTLQKEGWGCVDGKVYSRDGNLWIDRESFTCADFLEGSLPITFSFRDTKTVGSDELIIETVFQKISIPVIYRREAAKRKPAKRNDNQILLAGFFQTYVGLRTGRLTVEEYGRESMDLINRISVQEVEEAFLELCRFQILVVLKQAGMLEEEEEYGALAQTIENRRNVYLKNPLCRNYFYYLMALYKKDKASILEASLQIRDSYEKEHYFYDFWMLLYVDRSFALDLKGQCERLFAYAREGENSPLLYLGLLDVLNQNPYYLEDLKEDKARLIGWGIRHGYLSLELSRHFAKLTMKEKFYRPNLLKLLQKLYKIRPDEGYLTAICSMLIKGNKVQHEYHSYFEQALGAGLKIVGLNEYYLRSLDFSSYPILPKSLLLYFQYSNSLDAREKAYLYTNILHYEKQYDYIYQSYLDRMEEFVKEQMMEGRINRYLQHLYEYFLPSILQDTAMVYYLPNIIFKKKITVTSPGIVGVYVCHDEMEEEIYVPFVDGIGQVETYSDGVHFYFADEKANRYKAGISYTLHRYLNENRYMELCLSHNLENKKVLLKWSRVLGEKGPGNEQIANMVLETSGMKSWVREKAVEQILDHHFEEKAMEELDLSLIHISLDILIKIMSTVSLVTVAVFNQYNVAQWILHLLNK